MTAPKSKKTINYAHIFLHYKASVETLLTQHGAPQEIITKTIDLARDFLKQEIIFMCCNPTLWEKQKAIPIVKGKSIVEGDGEAIEKVEEEIRNLIGDKCADVLLDILDEIMLDDTSLYSSGRYSGWDVLDISETNSCSIKFINYGDYRILAWQHMVEDKDEDKLDAVEDNPSQEDIHRVLVKTEPMIGLEERWNTNAFDRPSKRRA